MILLLAGLLILVALSMVGRWFATAPPASVLKTAKWTAGALSLLVVGLLAVAGRLGWALAMLAGLAPWLIRMAQMHALIRLMRQWLAGGARVQGASGGQSRVETPFLRMTLDHDSGALAGEVLAGPSAGRPLTQLSFAEASALHRLCAADPPSLQLIEAWLDRTWPDWRQTQPAGGAGQAATGVMSREEACEVLGVAADADRETIRQAHRRLMVLLHPDHGGTNYLAAKINQAKDVLTKD